MPKQTRRSRARSTAVTTTPVSETSNPETDIRLVDWVAVRTQAVNEVSTDYLFCRTFMHSWNLLKKENIPFTSSWKAILECTRCPVTKTQTISGATGEILHVSYGYPQDYRFGAEGGPTAADRGAMRLRVIKDNKKLTSRKPNK